MLRVTVASSSPQRQSAAERAAERDARLSPKDGFKTSPRTLQRRRRLLRRAALLVACVFAVLFVQRASRSRDAAGADDLLTTREPPLVAAQHTQRFDHPLSPPPPPPHRHLHRAAVRKHRPAARGAVSPVAKLEAHADPKPEPRELLPLLDSLPPPRSVTPNELANAALRAGVTHVAPPAGSGYPNAGVGVRVAMLRSAVEAARAAEASAPHARRTGPGGAHPPDPWAAAPLPRGWRELPGQPERAERVRAAARSAWAAYASAAMGADELRPIAGVGHSYLGGMGATVCDALSTLWLMNLTDEFGAARDWVVAHITHASFATPRAFEAVPAPLPGHAPSPPPQRIEVHVGVFETTIRYVGGLLSAAQLSGDASLVDAAAALASRLLPAFNTTTGIPFGWVQLSGGGARAAESAVLSEYGSLTLEFLTLSTLTGDPRFAEVVENALAAALAAPNRLVGKRRGLLPTLVSPSTGRFANSVVSVGAAGDSAYEYLVKAWALCGRGAGAQPYVHLFDAAADSIAAVLTRRSPTQRLLHIGEAPPRHEGPGAAPVPPPPGEPMQHLTCYFVGALVLAAEGPRAERYMGYASALAETCWQMYAQSMSGLAPDSVVFVNRSDYPDPDPGGPRRFGDVVPADARWQLRPEALEALFYLWRATGDEQHRDRAWAIFTAIVALCSQTGGGFTGLLDTRFKTGGGVDDLQPSWLLAETLKYAWLLFSESSVLPLSEWVLNTEGHPLRVAPHPLNGGATLLHGLQPRDLLPGGTAEQPWAAAAWRDALRDGIGDAAAGATHPRPPGGAGGGGGAAAAARGVNGGDGDAAAPAERAGKGRRNPKGVRRSGMRRGGGG